MRISDRTRPVAVVGGGFSGTIAAVQLLAALPADRSVLLCERADRFGRGLAYATAQPDHLLNVRAANMSAYADAPRHFTDWLERCGDPSGTATDTAGLFAARGLYGRYLAGILETALTPSTGVPRLSLVNDAVVDIVPDDEGYQAHTAGGRRYPAAGVVLALGNLRPPATGTRVFSDPWQPGALDGLDPDVPVLVVGTGLTMVDAALALRRAGLKAPVVAVSRRGLLAQAHAASIPRAITDLSAAAATPLALLRRLRRELAGQGRGAWRDVIDGLRPATRTVWQGWSVPERRRFLRHLRPYWDIHRHRMAPAVAAAIDRLRAEGGLTILAGRLTEVRHDEAGCTAVVAPRGGGPARRLDVQRVIRAQGPENAAEHDDPLVRRLLARGLARLDALGIGLDARDDLAILDAQGGVGRLWGLGPIVRGAFWECTAVPDIRAQAVVVGACAMAALAGVPRREALSPSDPARSARP